VKTNLQKSAGIAALYMAAAHLTGIIIFIAILNYPAIIDPAQKLAVNMEQQNVVFITNLLMYVIFGFALIVLSLGLYERLKEGALALMQAAVAVGIIWAGSLIASGMVANAGLAAVAPTYASDPAQAVQTWQGIEAVANGLGNANGEILGGPLTLLISLAGLRSNRLPKALNILGVVVGLVGIVSIIPASSSLTAIFGINQIIWFIWLGVVLLRGTRQPAA